ncbi:MAG: sugar phosphate isomerase/epimerase family protein [Thermoleophilaceae bacterium]
MRAFIGRRRFMRGMIVAAVAASLGFGVLSTASAAPPDCKGRGVPVSKVSIQLWTFAEYVGFGSDAATQARLEEVLRRLSEMGYRNVEPFTFNGLTAEQFRALLDKYGLNASAEHTSIAEATWDQTLADAKTLGLRYLGAGGTPRDFTTEQQWIDYAEMLNRLGERARQQGLELMVHNHNWEFQQVFGDRTAYDILQEHTDPRYVTFQLDLYWVTAGGADPVEVLRQYGDRIELFHVKDMAPDGSIEIVGEGIIDFPTIFDAAGGSTRYYVVEHDPRFGDPSFDPFEAAEKGFAYLDCVTL